MAKTPPAWMFTCPIFEKGKFYCAEGVGAGGEKTCKIRNHWLK